MIQGIGNLVRAMASVLNRDVRDLLKSDGTIVDHKFLTELRNTLRQTGLEQDVTDRLVADVSWRFRGRIVQGDQVADLVGKRLRNYLA